MPVNTEEFLRAVAILADDNNMRVTVKQSGKGAAICGAICFIGGLVGGPGKFMRDFNSRIQSLFVQSGEQKYNFPILFCSGHGCWWCSWRNNGIQNNWQ